MFLMTGGFIKTTAFTLSNTFAIVLPLVALMVFVVIFFYFLEHLGSKENRYARQRKKQAETKKKRRAKIKANISP